MTDSPIDIQGGLVSGPDRNLEQVKKLDLANKIPFGRILAELEKIYDPRGETKWNARYRVRLPIKGKPDEVELVIFDPNNPDYTNQETTLYPSDYLRFLLQMVKKGYLKGYKIQLAKFYRSDDNLYYVRQYLTEAGRENETGIDELALPNRKVEQSLVIDIIELLSALNSVATLINQSPDTDGADQNEEGGETPAPVGSLFTPGATVSVSGDTTEPAAPEAGGGESTPTTTPTPPPADAVDTSDVSGLARWISAPIVRELLILNQLDETQYPELSAEIYQEALNLIKGLPPDELAKLDSKSISDRIHLSDLLRAKLWRSPTFQRDYHRIISTQTEQVIDSFDQKLAEALELDSVDSLALDNLIIKLDTLTVSSGETVASVIEAAINNMTPEELATLLSPDTIITQRLISIVKEQKHHLVEMLAMYALARNAKLANATQVGGKREKGTFDEESKEVENDPKSVTRHLGVLFSPTGMVAEHGAEVVADAMEGSGKKHKLRLTEYYQKFLPVWTNLEVEVQKQAVLLVYGGGDENRMYTSYVSDGSNYTPEGKLNLSPDLFGIGMPWNEIIRRAIEAQRRLTQGENQALAQVAKSETQRIALVNAANLRSSFLLEFVRDLPADQLRAVKALLLIKDLTSLEQQLAGADESRRVAILTAFYKRLGLAGTLAASVQDKGVRNHIEERLRQLGETADKSANQLLPAPTDGETPADRTAITTYLSQQTVEITIITEVEDPLIVDVYGGEGDQSGIDSYGGASVDDIASTADEAADLQQKSQPKGVRGRLSNLAKKSKAWQKGSALKQKALQKLGGALAKKGLGAAVGAASGPAGWVLTAAMLAKDAAKFLKDPKNRKKIGFLIAGLGGGLALLLNKLFGLLSQAATIGGALVGAGVGFAVGGPLGALIGASIGAGAGWLIGNGLGGSGAAAGSGALASNALSSPGTGVAAATPAALSPTAAGAGLIAASTAAGAGGAVATGGGLLALGTATLIPLLTILGMMAITVYTVFVILSSFLAPLPVGDPTARNTRSSEYVTVTKEASPKKLDNGQTVAVTYTVSIKPKPGYKIALSDLTDSANDGKFQILSNNPAHRHDPTFTPTGSLISISSFPPEPFGSSVSYTYNVTMAGGVDVLVRNNFEITYTVLDRAGQTVKSNQKLSTAASVIIGDPKVSCWPTSGGITQLPNGGWSHGGVNAYDIAAPLGSRVFAPVAGTAYRKESRSGLSYTGYGLYVEMEFTLANNLSGRLVFGHLSSVPANITGAGTAVNPGDVIGRVGSTGNSTGSHLHYELRDWPGHLSLRDFFPTLISDKPGLGAQVYTCF